MPHAPGRGRFGIYTLQGSKTYLKEITEHKSQAENAAYQDSYSGLDMKRRPYALVIDLDTGQIV